MYLQMYKALGFFCTFSLVKSIALLLKLKSSSLNIRVHMNIRSELIFHRFRFSTFRRLVFHLFSYTYVYTYAHCVHVILFTRLSNIYHFELYRSFVAVA